MSWFIRLSATVRILLIVLVTGSIVLAAIGVGNRDASSRRSDEPGESTFRVMDASDMTPGPMFAAATPPPATPDPASATPEAMLLSPEELVARQPNELGVVPILEYHVITTNPEEEAQFVRLADDMRADLQWLYDNNFYVVPLRDVINNTIDAPAGKHPVALTFDDGTSSQFRFIEDENGDLVPDPDSAIGILEAFYQEHPDFGRGGHFGVLIYNAFSFPEEDQDELFEQKIAWMVERGYEIGNHTMQHTNLTDITNDEFTMTIAEPMIWANDVVGDVPENASHILTLPYGSTPDGDLHPDQRQKMREGFMYNGEYFRISAALLVGAEPAVSPASSLWDPMWVPRIQMFDESVEFWFGMFERGETILYTSDGNPETVAVPMPLHPMLQDQLDVDELSAAGKTVIPYDPETGQPPIVADDTHRAMVWVDRRETRARASMVNFRQAYPTG